ncbi:uncharacterized protein F5147DRAFT_726462 [Suillus discolor]|uniref:Secreted protein n=1 Tax=Suillus discolor TaxID=1912936 RepID=A0A9P7ETX4_9AGAM|nr:uncharacterized protein F5147DRAFT_726462 [Suillus discolor]KAG2088945.1 hypothetical protein F5147DRAFT_726462 [Suillus discolor]
MSFVRVALSIYLTFLLPTTRQPDLDGEGPLFLRPKTMIRFETRMAVVLGVREALTVMCGSTNSFCSVFQLGFNPRGSCQLTP